ncbi:MAG: endonuclease [Bacilli bacterium]
MNKKILIISSSFCLLMGLVSFSNPINYASSTKDIFSDASSSEVKTYYSNLKDGLKGEDLLDSLETIIKTGHTEVSSSQGGSSWSYYLLLDRDYVKDPLSDEEKSTQKWKTDDVVCSPLYDTTLTYKASDKPGTKYIDREHVLPKSYGFGNKDGSTFLPYAATDMHNLHMGEKKNNENGHNNYAFGNVKDKASSTQITSTISGNVTGYLGENTSGILVYEPMDKDKGDIARTIFYMATRYHTYDGSADNSPALKLSDTPTKEVYESKVTLAAIDTKDTPCEYGILSDLLKWNVSDPVDDHEIHRNNLVYNAVQGNRNPYIDYPSWANSAFGTDATGIDTSVAPTQFGDTTTDPTDPSEPETPETPSEDTTEDPWYIKLIQDKYFPWYCVLAIILLLSLISFMIGKKHKRKSKNKKK